MNRKTRYGLVLGVVFGAVLTLQVVVNGIHGALWTQAGIGSGALVIAALGWAGRGAD